MKRLILVLAIFLFLPVFASAQPGRTDSDGCHYCRTNCKKRGVPFGRGISIAENWNFPAVPISKMNSTGKGIPS